MKSKKKCYLYLFCCYYALVLTMFLLIDSDLGATPINPTRTIGQSGLIAAAVMIGHAISEYIKKRKTNGNNPRNPTR